MAIQKKIPTDNNKYRWPIPTDSLDMGPPTWIHDRIDGIASIPTNAAGRASYNLFCTLCTP